jgi:hypothetical protein
MGRLHSDQLQEGQLGGLVEWEFAGRLVFTRWKGYYLRYF